MSAVDGSEWFHNTADLAPFPHQSPSDSWDMMTQKKYLQAF
jgi:hypothetical protein